MNKVVPHRDAIKRACTLLWKSAHYVAKKKKKTRGKVRVFKLYIRSLSRDHYLGIIILGTESRCVRFPSRASERAPKHALALKSRLVFPARATILSFKKFNVQRRPIRDIVKREA